MKEDRVTLTIVLVAFFAAITFVATSIQVPMPSLIGKPFVHLGNAAALLSVLLLGYKRGALAGGMGLAIFDLTHNYVLDAPYYFFEVFVVGGAAILVARTLRYQRNRQTVNLVLIIFSAIITKFITSTLHNFVMALVKGLTVQPAIAATITSIIPTIVNCIITMIVVLIVFPILDHQLHGKLMMSHN
ncbi:MAG: ECF transporter S component [Leuconostoc carnosum]|uniref:ECF transporter S component n=1 Tax=Leuconostoc carnosum TaxID=1252 RepID=UPI00345DC6B1